MDIRHQYLLSHICNLHQLMAFVVELHDFTVDVSCKVNETLGWLMEGRHAYEGLVLITIICIGLQISVFKKCIHFYKVKNVF